MRGVETGLTATLAAAQAASSPGQGPVKVEVARTAQGYVLMRGGVPYPVRGAGMSVDRLAGFAARGGNSIRNWTTDDEPQDIRELLDRAHAHGVTVALCLPMRPERHGFDYDDARTVAAQLESFRAAVLRYRDHAALLAWIIGNELNHSYTNPRVYDAVEQVARMIHELDPDHPATTTIAGLDADVVADIQVRAPSLDFLSFQLYGALFDLPGLIREAGYAGPFMVTEWGAIGYWEVERTAWGAPIELDSSAKADVFRRGQRDVLSRFEGQLLGSYAFLWGQKQERTPTWFGLFLEGGEATEAVDVLQHGWTGRWPEFRAPLVRSLRLDGRGSRDSVTLVAGRSYEARLDAVDPAGGPLQYRWEVKPESTATQEGGDFEEPIPNVEDAVSADHGAAVRVRIDVPGRYRLFAYAFDGRGQAAHANIPFLVEAPDPQDGSAADVSAAPAR